MEFSCQVCLTRYDSEAHRPLLLPACGHSFCAFCVQILGQQGKTYCPKCRKEKAVQPVSSLPVNYSLLEIVQNTSLGAAAEEPPEPPSNPMGGTTAGKMPPHSSLPTSLSRPVGCTPRSRSGARLSSMLRHKRMNQNSSSLIRGPMFPPVSPSATGYTSFPAPATSTVQAHNPNSPEAGPEKELQDELDFQMAIHLTFCKDLNHDINQHNDCPVWRRERENNEDVASVLAFMQEVGCRTQPNNMMPWLLGEHLTQ